MHNNIIAQLELIGMPYSSGFDAGEGVRLVLGSDIMGVKGVANKAQIDVPTRWLIPASVAAFDPRCNKADMDAALADGCVLLGVCPGHGKCGRVGWRKQVVVKGPAWLAHTLTLSGTTEPPIMDASSRTCAGTHSAKCTSGCDGDAQQEAAWAQFKSSGSAEYPVELWQVRVVEARTRLYTSSVHAARDGIACG